MLISIRYVLNLLSIMKSSPKISKLFCNFVGSRNIPVALIASVATFFITG